MVLTGGFVELLIVNAHTPTRNCDHYYRKRKDSRRIDKRYRSSGTSRNLLSPTF